MARTHHLARTRGREDEPDASRDEPFDPALDDTAAGRSKGRAGATRIFRIVDGPSAREPGGDIPLTTYYQAEFATPEGDQVRRYVTDKGCAAILRELDRGRRTFTAREIDELTVPPDERTLLERTITEGGDGA